MFALKTKNTPEARKYVEDTSKRLSSENLVNNPFKGSINALPVSSEDELIVVVEMEPVYPSPLLFSAFALLLAFGLYVVFGL